MFELVVPPHRFFPFARVAVNPQTQSSLTFAVRLSLLDSWKASNRTQSRTRELAIKELIDTEEIYANDLSEVQRVFYDSILEKKLLDQEQLDSIFLNWRDLYNFSLEFHQALVSALHRYSSIDDVCIGDVILKHLPRCRLFLDYSVRQSPALGMLQHYMTSVPQLGSFIRVCEENMRIKGLPISSYLLKPLQRLTKYRLLLQRISETTPIDHPDFRPIEQAAEQLNIFLDQLNRDVGITTEHRKLHWLRSNLVASDCLPATLIRAYQSKYSSQTCLLHYGTVYKAKSNRKLVAFLFRHHLLLTIPVSPTGGRPFEFPLDGSKMSLKVYRRPISLREVIVTVGTSFHNLDVNKIYRSHSVMSVSAPAKTACVARPQTPCNSSAWTDADTLFTANMLRTTFSLFLSSNQKRPLISLKASCVSDRNQWVANIWNAIWSSRPMPLIALQPSVDDSIARLEYLCVSLIDCSASVTDDLELTLEFAVNEQPKQTCCVSFVNSITGDLSLHPPMRFACSESERSGLLYIRAFSLDDPSLQPLGYSTLPMAGLLRSAVRSPTKSFNKLVDMSQSSINLQLGLRLQFEER